VVINGFLGEAVLSAGRSYITVLEILILNVEGGSDVALLQLFCFGILGNPSGYLRERSDRTNNG
jgi:hypothetical protein